MKKICTTTFALLLAFISNAQPQASENFDPFKSRDFLFDALNISAVIIVIYLISSFLIQIFRNATNYRLKNRMLDKGTEADIVRELLLPEKKDNKNYILQWFFMLIAIGIGFLLLMLTRPFGIHSMAILAFSIAAGFGAYYYFTRQKV